MKIIKNKTIVNTFIDTVLPELFSDECVMLSLFARKKYLPKNSPVCVNGITQLHREFVYRKKDILKTIHKFELASNIYTDKQGHYIPEDCMTLYVTPNPRSNNRAAINTLHKLIDLMATGEEFKLLSCVRTELHKASSRKVYLDFDIDIKPPDNLLSVLEHIKNFLGDSGIVTVLTKGGAHVLLELDNICPAIKTTFYKNIQQFSKSLFGEIEIRNDALLPFPGCRQGDFIPIIL
jgi:hypothetical protein